MDRAVSLSETEGSCAKWSLLTPLCIYRSLCSIEWAHTQFVSRRSWTASQIMSRDYVWNRSCRRQLASNFRWQIFRLLMQCKIRSHLLQSVLPADQPTQPYIQRPYLPIAPEQEDRQSSSHQTKRAAGRPPKKKIFNFSPCTPSVLSSQQPSVVVYPQLPTPSSTLPVDSSAPSPALAEPFTSNAAPQRPQRIKRKPDWYGGRE